MEPERTGPHAMKNDPPIFDDFRAILKTRYPAIELAPMERMAFYESAGDRDVTLTIATADERLYANLLLTIGVVRG